MKTLILIAFISLFLFSCTRKPEFFIDGKPYYTKKTCIKSVKVKKNGYHYDYNLITGKYDYHFGDYTETKCVSFKIDTIEIK